MSLPTKPIEDVLKDAQEVNSLETADRMGVIGENGELKKVSLNTIKDVHTTSFRISNNQWLRFAKYTYSVSPIGLILLSHTWNAINPQSTALVVSSPSGSELSPINVSVLCNTPSPSFNAIRCVADGNNRYLEVRFAKTTTNNPVIRVVGLSLEVVPYSISTASDSDVINTVSLISGWGG